MTVITDPVKINELLRRGVEQVFVREDLEKKLLSGQQLRIKLGIDPTGPKIHIGRAVTLRKLRAFQDLGHQVVLIVGDFTATIGDASDKDGKRPLLSREVIEENFQDYKNQIGKVLDLSKIEFRYNSEWLEPLTFRQVGELAEDFSVQQMLRRRNFSERYERGDEISLREFMYPLMQGYDSVVIKSDVEIGGFDQLFNLQAGRILQKAHGMPQQDIMTLQMLEGTDGRKMSTSWGNIITIVDEPNDMFGKIMSIKDDLMAKYFTLCTDVSDQDILDMEIGMQNGDNPMQHKKRLAREIVAIYHSPDAAVAAQESWEATFSDGGIPDDAPEYALKEGETLLDVLVSSGIAPSRSEARRLIEANAVTAFGESGGTVLATATDIPPRATLRIGKKKFLKIV
jgi:tyrosyl-tRNA synthetase